MTSFLDAALSYRGAAWSCIPVTPGAKAPPLVAWEPYQTELPDHDLIRDWWTRWPLANIAVVTGRLTGITVIDVDGAEGEQTLRDLKLPPTYTFKTPRPHGWHLVFQYHSAPRQGVHRLPGCDVRTDGGYIVAPPSVRPDGAYTIARNARIAEFPAALLTALEEAAMREGPAAPRSSPQQGEETRDWVAQALRGVSETERNDTATRLVGHFHRKGLSAAAILQTMTMWARMCRPPMDQRELEATVRSVLRYPGGPPMEPIWKGEDNGARLF